MLQNVYRIGKPERIYIDKLGYIRIRRIYIDVLPIAENVLVFALCGLYYKKRDIVLMKLGKHLIDRVALAGACRTGYERVHIKALVVELNYLVGYLSEIEHPA